MNVTINLVRECVSTGLWYSFVRADWYKSKDESKVHLIYPTSMYILSFNKIYSYIHRFVSNKTFSIPLDLYLLVSVTNKQIHISRVKCWGMRQLLLGENRWAKMDPRWTSEKRQLLKHQRRWVGEKVVWRRADWYKSKDESKVHLIYPTSMYILSFNNFARIHNDKKVSCVVSRCVRNLQLQFLC
jgi:hypothetical protein